MKHLGKVTIQPTQPQPQQPLAADFKTDYLNALYRDTSNYIYEKKNTFSI